MEAKQLLRVVALRKGKLPPAEFRLRGDEKGLSLFTRLERPGPEQVLDAVRAAGKRGELKGAVILATDIENLGLTIVPTPGGAPSAEVNAIHCEARFPWWRRFLLRMRGIRPADYFNEHVSPKLCAAARLLD